MTFLSALILGLVASVHCAGMCGGLQMALQGNSVVRSQRQMLQHVLLLNVGRLITYVTAGVLLAIVGIKVVNSFDIPQVTEWARILSGAVVLLIGIQLLFKNQRPFGFLEFLGSVVWQKASKLISHSSTHKRHSLLTGIAWGFLPCGLVYGVLIVSMFANDALATGLVMLGFGLGTMPALLLTGTFYQQFRQLLQRSAVQFSGGVFFIVGGVLMLSAPLWVNKNFLYNYPELLNIIFCVT